MTLTDKWKKGELEQGWHYVLLFSNEEYITFIDGNWVVDDRLIGDDIKEVLAPVPSYEEWQEEQKSLKVLAEAYCKEKEENQQLKEVIRECRNCVTRQIYGSPTRQYFEGVFDDELLTKIDNAIGEKK